tara:strand:+ start:8990 stop:9514 length:525 start_codon:yes stop_codon:yes gene_type:complete
MALTTIAVTATDHFAKGGVKTLSLCEFDSATNIDLVPATKIATVTAQGSTIVVIEFEKETAKMTSSTSQERGLAMTTIGIEGYIPNINAAKLVSLEALVGVNLNAVVTDYNGVQLLVGLDSVLGSGLGSVGTTTSFGLFLESIELDLGAALSDGSGATLKLTAVQGELPYTVVA